MAAPSRLPISRRNSFSRDAASAITLARTQSFENSPRDHIQLHVNDSLRSLSPRKSASFSLPRNAQQSTSVSETPSDSTRQPGIHDSSDRSRVLRAVSSDSRMRWQLDQHPGPTLDELLVKDSPVRATTQGDESPVSSYSPAGSTIGSNTDDAFEDWLHETTRTGQTPPLIDVPAKSEVPRQLAELLQREHVPAIELSKSVQQIELEIRSAIESAASRVTSDLERKDQLAQQLHVASGLESKRDSSVSSGDPPTTAVPSNKEPELLLLLMEVLIGDGRSETIEVHEGDEPERLAEAFAAKHGLGTDAVPQLTQHIREQVEALADEEESDTHEYDGAHRQGVAETTEAPIPVDAWSSPRVDPLLPVEPPDINHDLHNAAPIQYREHEREHSYNHLMEKYGHYTSHSNKVDPTFGHKDTSAKTPLQDADSGHGSDTLTMRNIELSEHTRLVFHPRPVSFGGASARQPKDKDSVFSRLYSLAESREKWIRRQQKAKAAEEMKERQQHQRLEISAKSRDMVAGRTNGGFANIGERLHEEALAELARKEREREKRTKEKAQQLDWTCPKCAFVNQHSDDLCQNVVASLTSSPRGVEADRPVRRESSAWQAVVPPTDVACGYPRPEQLFRPTLVSGVTTAASRSIPQQKQQPRGPSSQSQRRQRTQQLMEDEFKQTCPFRPKINELSEEIMRDKLEQEAKAAGRESRGASRRNPHQALYEDAFHARAQREVREQEYLSQFSFKPDIGVNSLWDSDRTGTDDVVERLAVAKFQELERKRQSLHDKYTPDRDPTTGRLYFQPETGRAPIFNRNERGLPIGEFLYQAHKEHTEYHRRLKQQDEEQIKQQSQQRYLSDRSKQALEERKKRTFARIFDYVTREAQTSDSTVDANQDRIVPDAVDLSKLPLEVARVVRIVFEFANHEPFTFADFEQHMDKLIQEVPGFTYTQVLFLTEELHDGKSARATAEKPDPHDEVLDPELTFHPSIDKHSDALAKKHGRADRTSVYEALNQYFSHYKDRKEQLTKHREREFARTHPFQPTFVSKDRKAKAAAFYDKLQHKDSTRVAAAVSAKEEAAALRTAVPNARPFVRPLGNARSASDDSARSRSTSLASSKHSDDEDAALTSRVLAALDEHPTL